MAVVKEESSLEARVAALETRVAAIEAKLPREIEYDLRSTTKKK